jgi:hypothetical protein
MKPGNNHIRSRGIGIVEERLRIMNNLYGTDCKFSISDLFPERKETGTKVIIEIPFVQADKVQVQYNDTEI